MLITMDKMTCKPSVKHAVINSIRNTIPTRIMFCLFKFLLHPLGALHLPINNYIIYLFFF